MYQLIQIPFQKFFQFFMHQPQHLPCFKIFFCILCTNRSPSPVDLHSNETSADPHHVTDTPHQSTPAPRHTCRYAPTFPRSPPPCRTTVPCSQPYNRTTVPHSQLYSQPYHRTTAPHPQTHPHTTQTISTPHHSPTMQPHDPDTRRPVRRRPDAVSTPVRRRPDAVSTQYRRRLRRDRRASPPPPPPADAGDGVDATQA